jgi:hypothetical protein
MYYNATTKEVTYATSTVASPTSIVNGTSNVVAATANVSTSVGGSRIFLVSTSGAQVYGHYVITKSTQVGQVVERFNNITSASGVVIHDCSNGTIFRHTTVSANFTANFTNLSIDVNSASVMTLMLNQGATAYLPTAIQIDSFPQTIRWQGGTVPTGNANKLDAVAFTIFCISVSTYVVTGQLVSYG